MCVCVRKGESVELTCKTTTIVRSDGDDVVVIVFVAIIHMLSCFVLCVLNFFLENGHGLELFFRLVNLSFSV